MIYIPRIRILLFTFLSLAGGLLLGLVFLEMLFFLQPALLFRGMPVPAPVDTPLITLEYNVYSSDGDIFTWRPDLVMPISAGEDHLEEQVIFRSDVFGFRNDPPLSEQVDVVVLGRSHSLAAHLPQNWPAMLEEVSELDVLNLAYPGGSLLQRLFHFKRFGLPRNPRWVILEVAPSNDILWGQIAMYPMSRSITTPLVQNIWRQLKGEQFLAADIEPIYPLKIDLPDRQFDLSCCIHFMEFFTLDKEALSTSQDWKHYSQALLEIVAQVRSNGGCVALLYIPTKPTIYFPLASQPEQLSPTLQDIHPFQTNSSRYLQPDTDKIIIIEDILPNIDAGRDLLTLFASQNNLPIIDPTDEFRALVVKGEDPFKEYDSHWNELGHQVVARLVGEILEKASCP